MNEKLIRFTRGVPPPESFCPEQLVECTRSVLAQFSDVVLQYGPVRGFEPLRKILAEQNGVDPQRVILGQGTLQLQDLCARLLIQAGTGAFVEEPTYDRTVTILKRAGAQLTGFPLEEDGPDVAQIEDQLKKGNRPVIFYLIPDFQNPSGTVLSLEKRKRIANLAREYDFWIIEDSPYRVLRYRGQDVPSIFEFAPEHTLKMSSYSKLIAPGLRVGYVIAPEQLADKVARMAEDTYINASYLNQAIVYDYQQRGWLESNIQHLKELYQPRLDTMLKMLDQYMTGLASWQKPDGGFFVGVNLKTDVTAEILLDRANQAGLQLTDGRNFFVQNSGDRFVRLPFCALTPDEIEEGVARLANVVSHY
ncbi:MAG TPA: PLP-dependent aminotransferase family protein [Anaerolineaceae bacterium]|nr:PLP-dependent aminotransferase family protein [Anaerolineaceae bacterium]